MDIAGFPMPDVNIIGKTIGYYIETLKELILYFVPQLIHQAKLN